MKYSNIIIAILGLSIGFFSGRASVTQKPPKSQALKSNSLKASGTSPDWKTGRPVKLSGETNPRPQASQHGKQQIPDPLKQEQGMPPESSAQIAIQPPPPEFSRGLDPQVKEEMLSSMRKDGIPEEDIQNIIRGLEAPASPETVNSSSDTGDVSPYKFVKDLESSLKQAGASSQDIAIMVEEFNRSIEKQMLGTDSPPIPDNPPRPQP